MCDIMRSMESNSMKQEMKKRIETLQEKIGRGAEKAGRNYSDITLIAVSKTRTIEEITCACSLGLKIFGENRVQEADEKFSQLDLPYELHIIGPLQSNKVRRAVEISDTVQSVDRLKILKLILKRCDEQNKHLKLFLEFNTAEEASKHGFTAYQELQECVEYLQQDAEKRDEPLAELSGLMTIGPLTDDETEIRNAFIRLRKLRGKLEAEYPSLKPLKLSMGMSGDYRIAIEEGSDIVRIGSAIFGARN